MGRTHIPFYSPSIPLPFPLHSPSIPLSPTSTFRTPASDTYTYSLHPEPPENNHRYTTIYI